jgi:hypothetical protein
MKSAGKILGLNYDSAYYISECALYDRYASDLLMSIIPNSSTFIERFCVEDDDLIDYSVNEFLSEFTFVEVCEALELSGADVNSALVDLIQEHSLEENEQELEESEYLPYVSKCLK